MAEQFDTLVVGGGLTGCIAALDLARKGLSIALVAPQTGRRDGRTTALMQPTITMLDSLGIWSAVQAEAAPLSTMRIVDATKRLLRAPTTTFRAGEIGEDAFGYNISNAVLIETLMRMIADSPDVSVFASHVRAAEAHSESVIVTLDDGTELAAPLAVAADGRKSPLRAAAGIGSRTWSYPQSALVTVFSHRVPHDNISTEFHTEHGPFTQVPLPGNRSSLVWVMPPREAELSADLDADKLAMRIEDRMQSILGAVTVEEPARCFKLSGLVAHRFGAGRVVLVGEAAHVFPPIGAQGLNLGLRDVRRLSAVIDRKQDFSRISAAYDRARRPDIISRTIAVDLLNRSLLSNFLPVAFLRSAGLATLCEFSPLRNMAMHEGMVPGGAARAFGKRLDRRWNNVRDRLRGTG